MALTDEESNTNEEQNVTFATGNGKLLFYNCLSRPIHFKVEKVYTIKHHILQQIKLEESRVLGKESLDLSSSGVKLSRLCYNSHYMHSRHFPTACICLVYLTFWASIFIFYEVLIKISPLYP